MAQTTPPWAFSAMKSLLINEVFEVHKPGFFKRFVACASTDDAQWLGRLIYPLECTLTRVHHFTGDVHYVLPDDCARATLELTLYYTGDDPYSQALVGRHAPET